MSRKSSMSIALARMVVLAVLTSLSVRRTFAADNGSPWGANYFPNVPLVTQDGKTVHFYADLLKGKMVVINFIYTKCRDSCPMETAKLAQVQRLLGDRVGRDVFFTPSASIRRETRPRNSKSMLTNSMPNLAGCF
jgi:protein SCO1